MTIFHCEGPFIFYGEEWAARMRGGGQEQSRRLLDGVVMKYLNKCGEPPNLFFNVNDSSNRSSAYIKNSHVNTENSHDIKTATSQQCVQIEFVEEIV